MEPIPGIKCGSCHEQICVVTLDDGTAFGRPQRFSKCKRYPGVGLTCRTIIFPSNKDASETIAGAVDLLFGNPASTPRRPDPIAAARLATAREIAEMADETSSRCCTFLARIVMQGLAKDIREKYGVTK